ncbi:hypothetical protein [Bacillus atrophaeus]|uniref:Uncharacterized protein n=1 Tax=Bacillus atrophaeus (strain 1942) TaxID=720555 RepID=A0ABM5LYI5_BACA1|nr:hypothetical protein [Bacillus atrophaeus]AMR62300.1 hypothetical protein A1D11_07720 [Bacillus subtilis subsp. globigii]ADP32911.1 hypothetical protein BATR1942_09890 [Bacillus atrophaeus 1942]AIK48030.1 hypothetical protein DJ95_1865 [Bacillus atrophaeus subsp. globigii]ASS71712.1 hypothetical protein BaGK_12460 [Bacillus atrophaeus]EIM12302.1 hypothetical protein UY9_03461 [Bacillus atrophaeus C89]
MAYSMDLSKNKFGARLYIPKEELKFDPKREPFIEKKVLHELGRGMEHKIEVTKQYDENINSYVFEAKAVILTPEEYRAMLGHIRHLEDQVRVVYGGRD